ncbi:hypothetical protein SAMN05446037_103229 [Anaerovirgula multivorans]|uniref:Uncharacterized protein n=1 Tax=Anaerovirgula multivorans TaxID=312168 RepID=A0A239J143_9FIRM|nr:hypothetical protein [Anaerovirgula multivorans]SNS99631.1 hypothetical protein SAMN05446037_103229 [Anaerovirgula multivorans]
MSKLEFRYPIMIFAKCSCLNQIPINEIDVSDKSKNPLSIRYSLKCPICDAKIKQTFILSSKEIDFTNLINVFKVIPSIKDELAIIKFDTVKGKLKNDEITFYGEYSHLRFWDKVIQKDIIQIPYVLK